MAIDYKADMLANIVWCCADAKCDNLSDQSLENALKDKCGYGAMMRYAKKFRDDGLLTIEIVLKKIEEFNLSAK